MAEPIEALDTIDLLYRAAVDPKLWPGALQQLAVCMGGVGTAMIRITPGNKDGLIVSTALEESNVEYQREWWKHDTRVLRIHSRRLSQGVCCEAQLFTSEELAGDPIRQDFLRRFGIGSFAAHLVSPIPNLIVAFSVQRALDAGEFDTKNLATLDLLGRHAARALTISMRLSAAAQLDRVLTQTLAQVSCAAILVDRYLRVMRMNEAAERLIGRGLTIRNGCLIARTPRDQTALKRLMRSVLRRDASVTDLSAAKIERAGRQPLLLQAIPITPDSFADCGLPDVAALILVVDPDDAEGPSPIRELRLLGLTPAEADIAALLGAGHSREETARRLGLSPLTVSGTVKSIYTKLQISRQSQLVRLWERLASLHPRSG